MSLMTRANYQASLRDGRKVWIGGERVADVTRHPAFTPMIEAVSRIYDLHQDPATQDVMTFSLPDGSRGSRFYKIPRSREDLTLRRMMTTLVLQRVGPTMDRFGDETVSPLFVIKDRKDIFDRFDPRYHANGCAWLERLERENLFMTSGNTDPKGDRSKQPFEQSDPDLNLRVVRETDAGIVVKGAKFETGAPYAHVAFVKPSVGNWVEENRDYAVACIVPLGAEGVRHICRMPLHRGGGALADEFDHPLSARFDEIDTMIVFDEVLVPWENVIFSREPKLAALMRSEFARWAAQGYLTRCLAKADLLVGTALLVSEQSGTIKLPQVRSKISQLMMHREAIRSFLVAAETECVETAAGHVMPNQSIQNAGRIFCSQTYAGMAHLLREIVGGQAVMLPDRSMLENHEIGADVAKYFAVGDHSAEDRLRALHLARELSASSYAGRTQAYQLFAETPIFAQEAALFESFDRPASLGRARGIAGLNDRPAGRSTKGEAA
jgi:4-hydroxyphenylacetate 3-monooxygenase